jgi:hypothetical protein
MKIIPFNEYFHNNISAGLLGAQNYVDFVDDNKWDANLENLISALLKSLKTRVTTQALIENQSSSLSKVGRAREKVLSIDRTKNSDISL